MTLPSGAHVKIGTQEFMLDREADEPYGHVFESLYSDTQKIQGQDATTANPNVLVWAYDDFAGGAEQKYYNQELPDTWWYGKCDPRVRGSLTSPPTQAQATANLTTSGNTVESYFVNVGGTCWLFADRQAFYSTDSGATWTGHAGNPIWAAGNKVVGATHDGNFPWVSVHDGTNLVVTKITSTAASTTAVTSRVAPRTYGSAMLEGKIYLWTGGSLFEYSSLASLPITHADATNRVHQPHAETPSGTVYAGIAAAEASLFYFIAGQGTTRVYEYKYNSATNTFIGRPVWNPPAGFTCRYITVSMGVVYLLGDYGDQVAVFGMSTVNREPLFLSYVGQQYGGGGVTLTPRALAPSYGSQVMLACDDGTTTYYYIYDAEIDSMSELDERTIAADGTCYALTTVGNRRLSEANTASTQARVNRWLQDFDTPAGGWGWVSSAWHMDFPYDEKVLFGFQVVQDPSIAAGTVQVEYQIDENGTWTSAGTTSAGVKYTYLDIAANNVKFRILRLRLTGASGARLFSVTTRAYVNSYQELWRLSLKLHQETSDRKSQRPTFRQTQAHVLRDYINTLVTNRSVVTFLDGMRYPYESSTVGTGYTSHTVVVEFPPSIYRKWGVATLPAKGRLEGSVQIVLRSVLP